MCGIAGLFRVAGRNADRDPAATAKIMVDTMPHRSPDGRDTWGDAEAGIGLAQGRLAIVDLSDTGKQPMHSADGRYVISYNGEVYNFPELRKELEARGHVFRGTSDTEVMLAACLEWGPEKAVTRFIGMFAFALFDRQTRMLRLVRDRLGVKPLYWSIADGILLFGSELRALMAHPTFRRDVNPEAIAAVLRYSYVPAPATVFRGVFKLPAASILTIGPQTEPRIATYWRLADAAEKPTQHSFAEAVENVDHLLRQSVRRRMIADVPIGAFLSGGTDSAAVVAQMQALSERPVRTFTVGFEDAVYDETAAARAVAQHLGTDHTEIRLDPNAALDVVGDIAEWFDEPFADSSQLPTYLVARATRRHVTVALSGDGGDELFAGYPKYALLERTWRYAGALPRPLRQLLGTTLERVPERLFARLAAPLLEEARRERLGEKMRRFAAALAAPSADHAALAFAAVGLDDARLVAGAAGALQPDPAAGIPEREQDLISRMQMQDMLTYLPDDILTKVDRCTMAVSLEAREPLLDHNLVDYIWSLPASVRRGDGRPKALLRKVVERSLPSHLMDRPKRGFSVPLDAWLSGPLRDWAENLLDPRTLKNDGLFDATRVRAQWQHHLAGTHRNATGIWNILMVRSWSERWLKS